MAKRITSQFTRGFTLVELSIVLVIIGLLVAGIAAGSTLVKQAEIRSIINEIQGFQVSYNNFKGTYRKIPGDMSTASSYWTAAACAESGLADDCNGNGDRYIDANSATGLDETRPAWKHLALAEMINAGIPVVPVTLVDFMPGVNAPASKLNGAGYMIYSAPFTPSSPKTTVLLLGKPDPSTHMLTASALSAQDAFSIDQKLDDGILLGSAKTFEVINSALAYCDITVDPTCDTGGGTTCDPATDPTCDPGGGDIGGGTTCDPKTDPKCDTGGGDTGGGTTCDPKTDPKCDTGGGDIGGGTTCDPKSDPKCDSGGGTPASSSVSGALTGTIIYGTGSDASSGSCSFENKAAACVLGRVMQ